MRIVEEEYHISMEQKLGEDLKIMCNLSQGVKEEGIAMGHKFGLEQGRREGLYGAAKAALVFLNKNVLMYHLARFILKK